MAHPLYQKPVMAEIRTGCGYDGRQVYGKALEKVFWPEDPQGLWLYDKHNRFIGYRTTEAHYDYYEGYCDIVEDEEEE